LEGILQGLSSEHIDVKLNTVRFLIDLFNSSKQLQSEAKEKFFTELIQEDLLRLLMEIMLYKESVVKNEEAKIASENEEALSKPIIGDEEMDEEYEVQKLALLKTRVAEILTNCFQILPSKVSSFIIR
jgi:hypothetical protein